jgi:hypothetical protein
MNEVVLQLLPFMILSAGLALGNYFLAEQLGKNRALWVILSLIPFFNFFFYIYVWYVVAIRVLDQLAKISTRLDA